METITIIHTEMRTAELQTLCQTFWKRIYNLEGDKFDLERIERLKKMEVTFNQLDLHSHTDLAFSFFLSCW